MVISAVWFPVISPLMVIDLLMVSSDTMLIVPPTRLLAKVMASPLTALDSKRSGGNENMVV